MLLGLIGNTAIPLCTEYGTVYDFGKLNVTFTKKVTSQNVVFEGKFKNFWFSGKSQFPCLGI